MSNLNELMYGAYVAAGATAPNYVEAEKQALVIAGAADGKWETFLAGEGYIGSINDMLFKYLGDRGYTGGLQDRLYAAATAQDLFTLSTPFDPATLSITAGRKRNWWHINGSAGSLSIGSLGNGGTPAVTDPVGSIILAGTDCYTLSYGNLQGVLRADGVEFPETAYFIKSLGGTGNIRDTGFTIGARFKLTTGSLFTGKNSFGGSDVAPEIDTLVLDNGSPARGAAVYLDNGGGRINDMAAASADYSTWHTILCSVIPNSGTTMDVIVRFDGVTVATGQLQSNNAWDRDLPYWLGASTTWMSRIHIQQGFSDTSDLVNIENFLAYGA